MDAIIDQCREFLNKSDARYSRTIIRAVNDLKRYSGDFWNTEYMKQYNRKNRVNLSLNNWNPMVNAISSPISNSPWHIELTDKRNELEFVQENIDNLESYLENCFADWMKIYASDPECIAREMKAFADMEI